uniref:Uncharacterized protein n=1 Tax=Leersia perrieri TaxID=77586 RepID=A0A0D9XQJ5_9ORYZ
MDALELQTGEIQHNLKEHMAQTLEWQHHADAQVEGIGGVPELSSVNPLTVKVGLLVECCEKPLLLQDGSF